MKPTEAVPSGRIVRVGVIGCGMVTQAVHMPTLNFLFHIFQVTYLYDASDDAMRNSQLKVAGTSKPETTQSVEELCNAPKVDLVLIASHHAFHASHAILALQASKHVFIEKPIALTLQDTDLIIEAQKTAGGAKVFIGYMRRYAAAFNDAVKEVGNIGQVRTFSDYREEDSEALRKKTEDDIEQALHAELGIMVTKDADMMWHMLSMLGLHDLSAMREILGMPKGVVGLSPCATTGSLFWSAIFQYPNFAVAYKSGVDQVARFDASIEIFGDTKTVKVCIDTPFIKGLPTTMVVKDSLPDAEEVYEWVVDGKTPKTGPVDARQDLEILGMPMKAIAK
ncbi:hypothetical protein GQ44DRAFT_744277 [Phaeosphaeriaceae sp. PMI808]|nr:hypothetical protein GQ44DRAFT_744277 [Phaeosphaeriaceae sp. PMI808]